MFKATLRFAACVIVCGTGLVGTSKADDCEVIGLNHYRPPTVFVGQPAALESNETTNVAVTAPEHNRTPSPLVPQPPKIIEIPMVEAAVELQVRVNFALHEVGSVVLRSQNFEQELTVTEWNPKKVAFLFPNIGVLQNHYVSIHIYRPDGYLVRQFPAKIVRSQAFRVVDRGTQTIAVQMETATH